MTISVGILAGGLGQFLAQVCHFDLLKTQVDSVAMLEK
jgi:hypothetical protein